MSKSADEWAAWYWCNFKNCAHSLCSWALRRFLRCVRKLWWLSCSAVVPGNANYRYAEIFSTYYMKGKLNTIANLQSKNSIFVGAWCVKHETVIPEVRMRTNGDYRLVWGSYCTSIWLLYWVTPEDRADMRAKMESNLDAADVSGWHHCDHRPYTSRNCKNELPRADSLLPGARAPLVLGTAAALWNRWQNGHGWNAQIHKSLSLQWASHDWFGLKSKQFIKLHA